ncbi:Protein of unknown function [Lachnospiraceae bacterium YSD2013]|nr:Protein of unknown function [Lachnospiraceae bacterium YSD2013]
MLKRILKRLKEKCGAATIEAVVAFTGFLFVIVTILNVANYCRAQMVISNAVDAAARELAQYSYFYNMSGMEKFNNYVNENAGAGAANINDVIDGTNSVYTTLSGALSDTTDYGNHLADKVDNQSLNYQDIQTAVLKIDTNSSNIMASINSMEAKFNAVERNPLLYMKSLAAVASGEALDLAKSYVIAAPLAKLFTSANINSGELSVQQYLENLGIVGGFEGLNFNTSTMFSPGEQNDIHIRCYYKISLCNFVDKSLFDVPICKEAHCRAWLGGDDNPVKVSQQAAVQPAPERTMPEQADASSNDVVKEDVSGGDVSGADVSGGENPPVIIVVFGDDEEESRRMLEAILSDPTVSVADKERLFGTFVQRYNNVGGADFEKAKEMYTLSMQYGLNIDNVGLLSSTGTQWTQLSIDTAIGESIVDYDSYKAALSIYTLNSGLTLEEKVKRVSDMYNTIPADQRGDNFVPASLEFVESIKPDGTFKYKWPNNAGFADGYMVIKSPIYLPAEWDRYGSLEGTNFSPYADGEKVSWEKRSLPYEPNEDSYHRGTLDQNLYMDVVQALNDSDCSMASINDLLRKNGCSEITKEQYEKAVKECADYQKYLNDTFNGKPPENAEYGIVGTTAPCFGQAGGGSQYTLPISVQTMVNLGIAKEK